MNETNRTAGPTDNADNDARIGETLGRLGDRATPPPWNTIIERHQAGSRWALLPSPRDRRLWAVAAAGLVALIAVGSALRLGPDFFDGDATDIETIDNPEEVPDPSSTTTGDADTDAEATADEGSDALPVGCLGPDFVVGRELSVVGQPGRADIDGLIGPNSPPDTEDDDWIWAVAPAASEAEPVTPTHLLAEFNTVIVLSPLEPERSPILDTPWPLGFDLDGDGAEELLAFEQANNFKRVEVYRLGDCSIDRVPIDGGARLAGGFPVDAGSSSCQDWCNVGLVCLPDGTLVSTESEPLDRSDGRGDHRWAKVSWQLNDGALVEVDRETGVLDFDELDGIDVTNTVNCDVERQIVAQPQLPHGDEALAIAELLGTDVLVATTDAIMAPRAQGYVVVDGEVNRYDDDSHYRVVGVQGDALVTAGYGSWIADGPRFDLQGRPIDCPPYAKFVDGTAGRTENVFTVDPIIQDDGGWALLIPGYEFGDPMDFGDPLGFDALSEQWWEVPLWEVDCETGQRVRAPSTEGTLFPSLTGVDQVEVFLHIERRGGTTLYFTGGEGFVTVVDADGGVILDTEMYSWRVSEDGSVIAAMDLDGVVRGFDATNGRTLWTNDDVGQMFGAATFLAGDRFILAGRSQPAAAVVSISSGETLVTPTTFDNLIVRHAG